MRLEVSTFKTEQCRSKVQEQATEGKNSNVVELKDRMAKAVLVG